MKKCVIVLVVLMAVLTSAFAATSSAVQVESNDTQSINVTCPISENIPKFQLVACTTSNGTYGGSDLTYSNDAVLDTAGITAYFKVKYEGTDTSKAIRWDHSVTVTAEATDLKGANNASSTIAKTVSSVTGGNKSFKSGIGKTGEFASFNVNWKTSTPDDLPADSYSATVTVTFTVN